MTCYRFFDIIGSIKIDYLLFFHLDFIEIDCWSYIETSNIKMIAFNIVNNKIDWTDLNKEIVSEKCQEYCNKIQKLRVFI